MRCLRPNETLNGRDFAQAELMTSAAAAAAARATAAWRLFQGEAEVKAHPKSIRLLYDPRQNHENNRKKMEEPWKNLEKHFKT